MGERMVKDPHEAAAQAKTSEDAGNLFGLAEWGVRFREGLGVAPNEVEGARLCRRPADGGCAWANSPSDPAC